MENHEYANLFPMLCDDDLRSLADDIKANGQSEPIITLAGKILDGRNRFRACEIAGVEPRFRQYTGSDALAFVISHNLHRRHLDESQRSMVAGKLADLPHGGAYNAKVDVQICTSKDRKEAAKFLNVAPRSVSSARKVITEGIDTLKDMVESGEVSVSAAAEVAKLEPKQQEVIVSGGVASVKKAAKVSRESRKPAVKIAAAKNQWIKAKTALDAIHDADADLAEVMAEIIIYCQKRIS